MFHLQVFSGPAREIEVASNHNSLALTQTRENPLSEVCKMQLQYMQHFTPSNLDPVPQNLSLFLLPLLWFSGDLSL